ncbi:MAG: ABC transporter ATP-binding protein, partial [Planctomycetota bacterium]
VETVEALANALLAYKGTVLFTSHDRHFMSRVATSIIEVRDERVRNYMGDYDAYVYSITKEIEAGERQRTAGAKGNKGNKGKKSKPSGKQPSEKKVDSAKDHKKRQKQLKALERKIAKLDEEKKLLNEQLLNTTDPQEAMELHNKVTEVATELDAAEEQWLELSQ